jgi:hypothetical protein
MKQPELTPEERTEYLGIATRQSRRIGLLVEQLLEAAKLESGQVAVNVEPFAIGELLQDVVQKFSLVARDRGVALEVDAMAAATIVNGDIALLERVLDNLIDNALRHTPAGGCVTVQSEPRGQRVRIAVTDTGSGLTAEESRHAFDRFYRGDPGRSTSSGQSGLGLAIVKSILELHGCVVVVDSQPGHGASFHFYLPIVARSPGSPQT